MDTPVPGGWGRTGWNQRESGRDAYEGMIGRLEKIRAAVGDDSKLVETALRFVISHASHPVVIPGATKPDQVKANAAAGSALMEDAVYEALKALDGA